MTYREDIFAALDAEPSRQDNKRKLAADIGCSYHTARYYVSQWHTMRRDWAHDAVVGRDGCDGCPHVAVCWELYALDLPVLCERVTQDDVQTAERWAVLDAMRDARDAAAV